MQSDPVTEATRPINRIVEVGRAVLLMEPMADAFNDLLMVPPVRRVMLVAEAISRAGAANGTLAELVKSNDVINHLRTEGRLRGSGEVVVPKAFTSDFERASFREMNNG